MADRLLKFALSWGLCGVSFAAFGFAAALYFAFCSIALSLIDRQVLRPGAENRYAVEGLEGEHLDRRMLPRDRLVAIGVGLVSLAVAWSFDRFA